MAAAGKFKKRKYKEENQKKAARFHSSNYDITLYYFQLALGSFLAWFEGSQALDRIINMERKNKTNEDIVTTELVYMIKRVRINIKLQEIIYLFRNPQGRKR